ncbi:Uncharacterized protein TCM_042583 [Theobroma cacao]|uniref:Reverse transcriptase Ty1/copia-type domain-containing protein n=1 Tax=Theobroma cacao TaxID=3641 RepID=A0A061FLT7_THECC|nr:Uncharacterized protein TCM_042583 [Theobroma cacao]
MTSEPASYSEAAKHPEWIFVMKEELHMIKKSGTCLNKYKARLVVKGYNQLPSVDYLETHALVAGYDTLRLLLALSAAMGWNVCHLDIKSAFLKGMLEEEIYVQPPEGFELASDQNKVYKLHKALYGLKQAPGSWYNKIDTYLTQ